MLSHMHFHPESHLCRSGNVHQGLGIPFKHLPVLFPLELPKSVTSQVIKEYSGLVKRELLHLTTPKRRVSSMMSHAGGPLRRVIDDSSLDRFDARFRVIVEEGSLQVAALARLL
jgi:hypothetical protein